MTNKHLNPLLAIEIQQEILSRAHDALALGGMLLARSLTNNQSLAREYCWLLECDFKKSRTALTSLSDEDIRGLAAGEEDIRGLARGRSVILTAAERFHDNIRLLHKEVFLTTPELAALIQPAVNAIGYYAEALTDFVIKFNTFINNSKTDDNGKD